MNFLFSFRTFQFSIMNFSACSNFTEMKVDQNEEALWTLCDDVTALEQQVGDARMRIARLEARLANMKRSRRRRGGRRARVDGNQAE